MLVKFLASSAVLCVFFLSPVAAHGNMVFPYIRLHRSDTDDDYTTARSPTSKNNFCQGLPRGQPFTNPLSPGRLDVIYRITAAHQGPCRIMLDRGYTGTYTTIAEDPNCAMETGFGSLSVLLPEGDYEAALQFWWDAKLTRETYYNCADIVVRASGSNQVSAPVNGGAAPKWTSVRPPPPMIDIGGGSNNSGVGLRFSGKPIQARLAFKQDSYEGFGEIQASKDLLFTVQSCGSHASRALRGPRGVGTSCTTYHRTGDTIAIEDVEFNIISLDPSVQALWAPAKKHQLTKIVQMTATDAMPDVTMNYTAAHTIIFERNDQTCKNILAANVCEEFANTSVEMIRLLESALEQSSTLPPQKPLFEEDWRNMVQQVTTASEVVKKLHFAKQFLEHIVKVATKDEWDVTRACTELLLAGIRYDANTQDGNLHQRLRDITDVTIANYLNVTNVYVKDSTITTEVANKTVVKQSKSKHLQHSRSRQG
ncbi:hypothetical protein HDV05_005416 [Chytridiales sp. JEL 0842]|nr:hypothetical protein HDV05_005416 [Chytridiales sp. JEL 0842]